SAVFLCCRHLPVPGNDEKPEQPVQYDLQASNRFVVIARVSTFEHSDGERKKHGKPFESCRRSIVLELAGEIDETKRSNQTFLHIYSTPARSCGFCLRSGYKRPY